MEEIIYRLLYSRAEVAQLLGISLRKLDELVSKKALKPRRIDGMTKFHRDEIMDFAEGMNHNDKDHNHPSPDTDVSGGNHDEKL